MTINPLQTGTDNPLVGATWSLTLLQGAPILPDSAITARFGADGVVGGSGGCNRYRASYQVDGSSMTIGAAAGALMACPPLLMDQERAHLAALQTAVAYRIEGRALVMLTADDALAVKFRRSAGLPSAEQGSAAAAAAPGGQSCITGLATFSESTALPEDAVIRVQINDISLMDAPAVTMGEQRMANPGALPTPYSVCYNPGDIQPHHSYSMQARIEDGSGALLYINNKITLVITRGAPSEDVEIAVIKVA